MLGHEFMGEVVEVGRSVEKLKVGDRVVVPVPHRLWQCFRCQDSQFSLCENSNPNAWIADKLGGYSPAGIFGYSHMLGGYRRRPGRVRARSLRRRRAHQGSP